jgi:CMP-N-acetylneuraminic acid synthetase
MLNGRRVLAVVPARGGSKGIKLKNLREVFGVPLVGLVGDVCRQLDWLDRAVVSTDHEDIAAVAGAHGLAAPFRRPPGLSGDRIGDLEVLDHALKASEEIDGVCYDVILMLQPTAPLRRAEHVTGTARMLVDGGWDAVWTVSPTDSKGHPLKQLAVDGTKMALRYNDPAGATIIARQQLKPVFHRNGVAYAFTRECITDLKTIMPANAGALILDGHMVSIDTEWDIRLVEFILENDPTRRER